MALRYYCTIGQAAEISRTISGNGQLIGKSGSMSLKWLEHKAARIIR
jgi:hypothetical protein